MTPAATATPCTSVMEYLPNVTLRKELRHRGTLTPRQAVIVLDAILAGLEAVHSAEMIHRDLKPDNVLLGADGQIKLADFGLARAVSAATTTKTLMGTVGYVAPELVTRTGADGRTDLYTVGIMLYEMLTGFQPYTDDVAIQVAYRHVHEDVPPPSDERPGLSPRFDALVLWATSRNPDDRPQTATALREAVAEARSTLTDEESGPRPREGAWTTPPSPLARSWCRPRRSSNPAPIPPRPHRRRHRRDPLPPRRRVLIRRVHI